MRLITFSLFLLSSCWSFAQTAEQDSAGFDATMKWVERKLTYNYYDPTNELWWVNVIQERDNGGYSIKNIAAKHPSKVQEKIYYQRTFFLWDLNSRAVTVTDVPNNMGRFVEGKLIRLEGFKGEKEIATRKDGVNGSKVNYLNISIPKILEDSLESYAEEVGKKLSDALFLNARLFNAKNTEDNITSAFKAFRGNYKSEDGSSELNFEVMDVGQVRFRIKNEERYQFGQIGYDVDRDVIFFFISSSKHYTLDEMRFDEGARNLILKSENGDSINVIGRNTIEIKIGGKTVKYFRY